MQTDWQTLGPETLHCLSLRSSWMRGRAEPELNGEAPDTITRVAWTCGERQLQGWRRLELTYRRSTRPLIPGGIHYGCPCSTFQGWPWSRECTGTAVLRRIESPPCDL